MATNDNQNQAAGTNGQAQQQQAGAQAFGQNMGQGAASNQAQQQAQPQPEAPKRGFWATIGYKVGGFLWKYFKKGAAAVGTRSVSGIKGLFYWARPYAEDIFYELVGQKGTVVVIRDRQTNKEVERLVFDRKGRGKGGEPLDLAKIMERYKKDGFGQDVEISLYAVPDITYYRVRNDEPLKETHLAAKHVLRKEMWKANNKGTEPKGMDAAYKAFNRNQQIRYCQATFKQYMKNNEATKALDMLRDTLGEDSERRVSLFNYLLATIDEDQGKWLSRLKPDELYELENILRNSRDHLLIKGLDDYVDKDMGALSVEDRVMARVLLFGDSEFESGESYQCNQVQHALNRFDLQQEWAAKKDKFWSLDESDIWCLCNWAQSCQATDILNEQAEILMKGVADATDMSYVLGCFEEGTSPLAQYLACVHQVHEATETQYNGLVNQMWELYRHPDVQRIELEKLKAMLGDKELKNEKGFDPNKLRDIAAVLANLSIADVHETTEELNKLSEKKGPLRDLFNDEEFQQEFRRSLNIKGAPIDGVEMPGAGASEQAEEEMSAEQEVVVPDTPAEQTGKGKKHAGDDEMGMFTDFMPSVDTLPEEDRDFAVEQAKKELGLGGTELRDPSGEQPEQAGPYFRLAPLYNQFDNTMPNRPELMTELGIDRLAVQDEPARLGAVRHVWSEAMALCQGLVTHQQLHRDSISKLLVNPNDNVHDFLDKLLDLYTPILEDLRVACGKESVEQLIADMKAAQQAREIDQVAVTETVSDEPSQELLMARQQADQFIAHDCPDIPEDFYAPLFGYPFPSVVGNNLANMEEVKLQAMRLVAMADAVKQGRAGEDMLMQLYKDEPQGIVGLPKSDSAQEVIAAIDQIKGDYKKLRAEAKAAADKANNKAKGFRR